MSNIPPSPTREELARELLLYKMKEYSQDGFCASWMMDVEFDLWTEVDHPDSATKRESILSASRECRTLG